MLDLLITGGDVIDGTGAPRRRADVGVRDGRVVAIGAIDEPARRTIDADGRVVAPGFVDVHTHLDAQAFWDPDLSPSPLHGVTTVLSGNCGFTIAPLTEDAGRYLMPMLAKVEGMPLQSLRDGVPWNWRTTAEYLDALDGRLVINAGFMVGHSAIRRVVMGEAANERTATDDELSHDGRLLRDGLDAGGLRLLDDHVRHAQRRRWQPGAVKVRRPARVHRARPCAASTRGRRWSSCPRARPGSGRSPTTWPS